MLAQIAEHQIRRVSIVDDAPSARASYQEFLSTEAYFTPIAMDNPFPDINSALSLIRQISDAALCDLDLASNTQGQVYARFDGAQVVSELYKSHFPAVLCTKYRHPKLPEIMRYRRWIPAMIDPGDVNTDILQAGFQVCVSEFKEHFSNERKPWRQRLIIESIEESEPLRVYFVVPGWNANEVVGYPLKYFPDDIQKLIKRHRKIRLYAEVNIGAEKYEDLYFDRWQAEELEK